MKVLDRGQSDPAFTSNSGFITLPLEELGLEILAAVSSPRSAEPSGRLFSGNGARNYG